MTMPGDPDATMPVQGGPGGPGGPGAPGGMGADATQPVTRAEYPGGPGGPGGPGDGQPPSDDDDESNSRKLWMIAAGVLVLGLLIGVLVAVLASGGDDDDTPTTTTSSSTTTSSTTTTTGPTTTTSAASPQILQFNGSPSPYQCPGSGTIQLTWSTANTTGVSISIDGGGAYGNYGPTGNAQVPFDCPDTQHTYVLTANGNNGQKPQKTLVVQAIAAPTTTTTDPGP